MKYNINFFLFLFIFYSITCFGQEKNLSWEELRDHFECPKWFSEARFGIWAHWGAQSKPELGGGWYARHMYMQDVGGETFGKNAYSYHLKTFGHPSEIGFKDVIHQWKAKNLDTDNLMQYFKKIGAKYFMILANHHDRFDNFNSSHFEWNSVNMGPKRDIVGEFEKSSRKYGLPFGVSSHDDRFLSWWLPAFGADTNGPYKGVPYDGNMTKEDGKGKWWEGLDPANLYGPPPERRTPEWIQKMKENWVLRHIELTTKYDVDMLWFDGYGFPYGDYGKEASRAFYNYKLNKYGKLNAIVVGKMKNEPSTIQDIERGGANKILPYPWQGTLTFTDWFYKKDKPSRHNARTVIESLIDMNSKNGNLLLNVELLPDGTIPQEHKIILDNIGTWVNLNNEAIYASKPWKIYGDNLDSYLKVLDESKLDNVDIEALKKQKEQTHFNERTIESPSYGHDEVRFTTKGDVLYVFVLNPKKGKIKLPSLGFQSKYNTKKISSIKMLGSKTKIKFRQNSDKLILKVPKKRPNKYTTVFKIEGLLSSDQ
ncbi:alpha-L-fucosidase [Aureibaculum sp. 2210JD6-5]|uniref:alpha-L-fucosidase n=1 Tax=Aureibaculum sp. 2210JD6-5 TaxID=3103957 RepID=UPI002AAD6A6F|nr:alpha-L-fucosidase [Aureibaculum sp. 2210JD6-5]MDY7396897.1 alpha-L-fucosidase [Aureibaculum sp. 2210JD6-5]